MKAIFEIRKKIKVEYSDKRTMVVGWYQNFISAYYYMLLKNNAKIATLNYITLNVDDFCRVVSQGCINKIQGITPFDEFAVNSCIDLIHVLSLKFNQDLEISNYATIFKTQVCDISFVDYLRHTLDLSTSKELDVLSSVVSNSTSNILTLTCFNALHNYCMSSLTSDLNYLGLILCEQYNGELNSSFDMAYYRELFSLKYLIDAYYRANISTLRYTDFQNHYMCLVNNLKASIVRYIYKLQNKLDISQAMSLGVLNFLSGWIKGFSFDNFIQTINKLQYISSPKNSLSLKYQLDTIDIALLSSFIKIYKLLYSDSQMRIGLMNRLGVFNKFYVLANQCAVIQIYWLNNISTLFKNDVAVSIATAIHLISAEQQSYISDTVKASILKIVTLLLEKNCDISVAVNELNCLLHITKEYNINLSSDIEVYSLLQFIWLAYNPQLEDNITLHCLSILKNLYISDNIDGALTVVDLDYLSDLCYGINLETNSFFINDILGIKKYFNVHNATKFITKIIELQKNNSINHSLSIVDIFKCFGLACNFELSQSVPIKLLEHIIMLNKHFDLSFISDVELNPAINIDMLIDYINNLELQVIKLLNIDISHFQQLSVATNAQKLSLFSYKDFITMCQSLKMQHVNNVKLISYLDMIQSVELVYRHYLHMYHESIFDFKNNVSLFQSLKNNIKFDNPFCVLFFKDILSLKNEIQLDNICNIDFDLYIAAIVNDTCFNENGLLNYHGYLLDNSILLDEYILYA